MTFVIQSYCYYHAQFQAQFQAHLGGFVKCWFGIVLWMSMWTSMRLWFVWVIFCSYYILRTPPALFILETQISICILFVYTSKLSPYLSDGELQEWYPNSKPVLHLAGVCVCSCICVSALCVAKCCNRYDVCMDSSVFRECQSLQGPRQYVYKWI